MFRAALSLAAKTKPAQQACLCQLKDMRPYGVLSKAAFMHMPALYTPMGVFASRMLSTSKQPVKQPLSSDEDLPLDEIIRRIDTTLTPEQQEYVNKLKRKMKGTNSPRSLYRDVPRPDEIKGSGNFMPVVAENAEQLIDWALSHIPQRGGPRRSRHKKRMLQRHDLRRANDARRKAETLAAKLAHDAKLKRIRQEVVSIKAQGKAIREVKEAKAKLRAASAGN